MPVGRGGSAGIAEADGLPVVVVLSSCSRRESTAGWQAGKKR